MATLGLNMIVAGGEAALLRRCLTSVNARETFDELVIVNTSTDSSINDVASEFGGKAKFGESEYTIDLTELIDILKAEKVQVSKAQGIKLIEMIEKLSPDIRKIINHLQYYSSSGDLEIEEDIAHNVLEDILEHIKEFTLRGGKRIRA